MTDSVISQSMDLLLFIAERKIKDDALDALPLFLSKRLSKCEERNEGMHHSHHHLSLEL
jgi:hypothetical protein